VSERAGLASVAHPPEKESTHRLVGVVVRSSPIVSSWVAALRIIVASADIVARVGIGIRVASSPSFVVPPSLRIVARVCVGTPIGLPIFGLAATRPIGFVVGVVFAATEFAIAPFWGRGRGSVSQTWSIISSLGGIIFLGVGRDGGDDLDLQRVGLLLVGNCGIGGGGPRGAVRGLVLLAVRLQRLQGLKVGVLGWRAYEELLL
jgi:hypothetical protein